MAEARHQPGRLPAIILAVLVHVAFIAVLVFGVDWQNHEPAPMVAELWNSLPGVTAPPPPPPPEVAPEPEPEPKPEPRPIPKPEPKPEPPPAPSKADIALKKAKEEKAKQEEKLKEDKRKEEEKKKDQEKKKKLVEEEERKRVQESFQREQKDIQNKLASEIQAREAAETARRAAASARSSEIGKYTALIRDKVRSNIVAPPDLLGNPQAVFEVTVIPSGEVINVRLTKSSGNAAYDGAVERAIRKSSPLPLPPADKGLFEQFRQNELKIRPSE